MQTALDEIAIDYKIFMDKTTIIYGASGTGKSAIVVDILSHLKPHIDQIVVICPTDPTNKTYSNGIVQTPLIHYNLTEKLLKSIWERQEMLAAVYARSNNISILEGLFNKLNLTYIKKSIDKSHSVKSSCIEEINAQISDPIVRTKKIQEVEEKFKEFNLLIYKNYISKHVDTLNKMNLSTDEKFTLKYLNFNPRMVLIFDDCSADFKKIKTPEGKSILGKMFFQNRWAFLSIIIAIHDDKLLDSELRKNAFCSIFTSPRATSAYFKRDTNAFPPEVYKQINVWNPTIFQGFQKLVYIRPTDTFHKFTAKVHPNFQFGADVINEYCEKVKSEGLGMNKSNSFYSYFATPQN